MTESKICRLDDIPLDSPYEAQFEGQTIILCRSGEEVRAMEGICPHRGAQLSQGRLVGNVLVCPWHDWAFDVTTGHGLSNPMSRLCRYEVEVRDGDVFVSDHFECADR
jgi:nitrite reductase/ring-hydroxylating ferredoxin subunit